MEKGDRIMAFAVGTPYMAVGFAIVWAVLFVTLWVNELRSERENEASAAFMLSAGVTVAAVLLTVLMVAVAWGVQTYFPIFG